MKHTAIAHETWLDLSHAADYLGVHFTTLRRWADAGAVACIRTPGGRRRFTVQALDDFLARSGSQADCGDKTNGGEGAIGGAQIPALTLSAVPQPTKLVTPPAVRPPTKLAQPPALPTTATRSWRDLAIDHARESIHGLPDGGSFLARMSDEQRLHLRGTGQRLMVLLLQYNSRTDCCEAFLEEGRRIAREYSLVCRAVGLSVQETARVFLFFRRTILESVHETAYLGGRDDPEGLRLYSRSTDFLDQLLLDLIGSYMEESV